jgi:BED zinc finger
MKELFDEHIVESALVKVAETAEHPRSNSDIVFRSNRTREKYLKYFEILEIDSKVKQRKYSKNQEKFLSQVALFRCLICYKQLKSSVGSTGNLRKHLEVRNQKLSFIRSHGSFNYF